MDWLIWAILAIVVLTVISFFAKAIRGAVVVGIILTIATFLLQNFGI